MRTRRISAALLSLILAASVGLAQSKGGGSGTGTGSGHAGGGNQGGGAHKGGGQFTGPNNGVSNIHLPRGWGMAPPISNGITLQPNPLIQPMGNVIQPLGQVVQPLVGFPNAQGRLPVFGRDHSRSRTVFVPVPVALPYGYGYSDTPYYSQTPAGPQPPDSVTYVDPNPPTAAVPQSYGPSTWGGSQPPVTVNNYIYTVTPTPAKTTEDGPKPITLLAFQDHSIRAVSDYWQDGTRVYYITTYGAKDSISVEQLDMAFTMKLNDERNVVFELKPKN